MVFNIPTIDYGQLFGQAVGQGLSTLGDQLSQYREGQRIQTLGDQLKDVENPLEALKIIGGANISQQGKKQLLDSFTDVYKAQQAKSLSTQQALTKQQEELQKQDLEQRESQILAKVAGGEELTPEERSQLSPTSLRTLIGKEKPTFEPTEEKLEAERVSKLADEITKGYQTAQKENQRLDRMEELANKGKLSTPLLVSTLNSIGLPLGILSNPDTEEYQKLQQDFVRDVNDVFRGQIRVFEIESYLKTVPGLLNSEEGKKAIIRNRRLINEAAKLKYDTYRDILKENEGKKPRNLDLLIEDRVGDKIDDLREKFREGITSSSEKFQPDFTLTDDQGKRYKIPANKLEAALRKGLRFE